MKKYITIFTIAVAVGMTLGASAEVGGDPEKIGGWVFAYENDASGVAVAGNINRLEKAFSSGGDFKILADNEVLFTCTRVTRTASGVFTCTFETLNLSGADPLLSYGQRQTDGTLVIYRTSLFGGADRGSTTTVVGSRWYVRVR